MSGFDELPDWVKEHTLCYYDVSFTADEQRQVNEFISSRHKTLLDFGQKKVTSKGKVVRFFNRSKRKLYGYGRVKRRR